MRESRDGAEEDIFCIFGYWRGVGRGLFALFLKHSTAHNQVILWAKDAPAE